MLVVGWLGGDGVWKELHGRSVVVSLTTATNSNGSLLPSPTCTGIEVPRARDDEDEEKDGAVNNNATKRARRPYRDLIFHGAHTAETTARFEIDRKCVTTQTLINYII